MKEKLSPFVFHNRQWLMKKIISDYFRAKNMFANMDRESQAGQFIPFDKLKKLSDVLFAVKEDMHLLFKRLIDPAMLQFEDKDKITPNRLEIEFINNVGLLYHKAMVARELKYLLEHYTIESSDYVASKASLDTYMMKMRVLFDEGIRLIKRLFRDYKDNIVLLYYIVKNDHYVQYVLGESVEELLKLLQGRNKVDHAYVRAGKYCIESGWQELGKKFLLEALRINAKNKVANKILAQKIN